MNRYKSYLFSIREKRGPSAYRLTWNGVARETVLHVQNVDVVFKAAPTKFIIGFNANKDCFEKII